jgi:hypothetical protein
MTIFHAPGCEPAGGEINPDELIRLAPMPLAEVSRLLQPGPDQLEDAKTLIGLLVLLRESG